MRRPRLAFIPVPTDIVPLLWTRCVAMLLDVLHRYTHAGPRPAQNGSTHSGLAGRSNSAYRVILPFFLIVAVILLLVIRLVHSSTSDPHDAIYCPSTSEVYHIVRGDTCWDLSQARGCSVDDILSVNSDLKCERLVPGQSICLPVKA